MPDNIEKLFKFLLCEGKIFGKFLPDIWEYSDYQLEYKHDYIQLMFPIDTVSFANRKAPTVTKEDILSHKEDIPRIQENMRKSLVTMLAFYGLKFDEGGSKITVDDDFEEREKVWIRPRNHNYLRITRILKSLHLFGLTEEAKAFLFTLVELSAKYPSMRESCAEYWIPSLLSSTIVKKMYQEGDLHVWK